MPSPRYTDPGPAARPCARCRATHRTHNASGNEIPCPPAAGRWLITGTTQQQPPPAPKDRP